MVYGRGFDSRRLHHIPQSSVGKRARKARFHSAVASHVIQQHPGALGVWHGVSNRRARPSWGYRRTVINKLTDLAIRSFIRARRTGQASKKKLSDGGGLYLVVTPAGTAVWRVKYRFGGNERLFAAGTYPATTLESARAEREKVKTLLREGRDPVQDRRLERANAIASSGETFKSVAALWLAKQKAQWSPIHFEKSSRAFDRDVLPRIGNLPVKDITPQIVAGVIEAILKRGVRETAAKVLQHINGVFRFAQARGLRSDNPAEPVPEILPPRGQPGRLPALLTWGDLRDILRRAEGAHLGPTSRF
jgi:hypothetical protein